MRILTYICILILCIVTKHTQAQRTVTFFASDGLEITADIYDTDVESSKYMLLFHQAEYSRGEFQQIATRLIKLGFTCIAVDLRYGNEVNFVNNETAMRAKKGGFPQSMLDCEKDILATISYVKSIDTKPRIFLLGSSFSASLCLKIANERTDIEAVIGFSPGEFFGNDLRVEEAIRGLQTPYFVGCPRSEHYYVLQLLSGTQSKKKIIFKPEGSDGLHGAKTLWWESATRDEFWLSLLF
ncbi:MAG TPA: dienelactone hydrolase family protein, partial [Bacteroidales bacterium]|nr:dienelactone hydrolase family protein [Bacteroidales bacterium]